MGACGASRSVPIARRATFTKAGRRGRGAKRAWCKESVVKRRARVQRVSTAPSGSSSDRVSAPVWPWWAWWAWCTPLLGRWSLPHRRATLSSHPARLAPRASFAPNPSRTTLTTPLLGLYLIGAPRSPRTSRGRITLARRALGPLFFRTTLSLHHAQHALVSSPRSPCTTLALHHGHAAPLS